MSKVKKEVVKNEISKFTKEQLVSSSKYKHNRDLVFVILEDSKKYSTDEVDGLIKKYMKGKVK